MKKQMKKMAKTSGQKGPGGRALSSANVKQDEEGQAQKTPPHITYAIRDEVVYSEISLKAEDDDFPDGYIECIIRGEFSEPI